MNTAPFKISVAVVDDDPEFRQLVRRTLENQPDLECILECADGEVARAELPGASPRVVLMDIEMPGLSGIECLRELRGQMPSTRFMMLTVFENYDRIFESLKAGATGYLIKKGIASKLADGIRELNAGESPISPSIARKLIQTFQEPTEELSVREREIVEGLARGQPYKEIAENLGVSFNTVRTHVNRIYEKLHVHSRREAVERVRKRFGKG